MLTPSDYRKLSEKLNPSLYYFQGKFEDQDFLVSIDRSDPDNYEFHFGPGNRSAEIVRTIIEQQGLKKKGS